MLLPEVNVNEDIQGIQSESGVLPLHWMNLCPRISRRGIVNEVVDTMLKVIIYAYSREISPEALR